MTTMTHPEPHIRYTPRTALLRWLPMLLMQVFLTAVLIGYRFGPWKYVTQSDDRVIWIAILFQFSLLLGFAVANFSFIPPASKIFPWKKLLGVSLLFNVLFFLPTTYARTGSLFPDIVSGLTNPGEAYARTSELAQSSISIAIEYARLIFGPILYAYLPLSVFFWRSISGYQRGAAGLLVFATIALYVSMGTNKAIGEFALIIPLLALASFLADARGISMQRRIVMGTLATTLIVIFFNFFTATMQSRSGSGVGVGYFPPGNTRADLQNPVLTTFPDPMRPGILGILSYATQGYFALGLALDEPFEPMYGLGSSTFVSRQITKLLKTPSFEDRSYPAKLEKYGWDRYVYWSTIYLWVASDLSLYGVPFFCFLVGLLLLYSWRDALEHRSPFGVIMLSLNLTMLLYFTANNQIGQSGELLVAYFVTLLVWLLHRSRIRLILPGGSQL